MNSESPSVGNAAINIYWEEILGWDFAPSERDQGHVVSHKTQPCSRDTVEY